MDIPALRECPSCSSLLMGPEAMNVMKHKCDGKQCDDTDIAWGMHRTECWNSYKYLDWKTTF